MISRIRSFEILLIFTGYCLFLFAWIGATDPFPDRDSVNQLYFPFLNYLKASMEMGNDFFFLDQVMGEEYPAGILIIPWLISALNLQELFIHDPWLISLFLLLPLSFIAWKTPIARERRWLFVLALFFFPITQLCLKNFNLHSFNVLILCAGLVSFSIFLRKGARTYLVLALALFWFTCVIKHLGLILFLNAWVAYLLWLRTSKRSLHWPLVGGALILLSSIPFYCLSAINGYLQGLLAHNPALNPAWILAILASTAFLVGYAWFHSAGESFHRLGLPRFFSGLTAFSLLFLFLIWVVSMGSNFHLLLWMMASFIIGNLVIILFLRWIRFDSVAGGFYLLLLISLVTGLVFYFSRLGQVSAFFFLPLYLSLVLVFQEGRSTRSLFILVALFILFSNFFPGLRTLEKLAGSFGFYVYSRGFNGLHQNPLSWTPVKVSQERREFLKILRELDLGSSRKSILVGRSNLHHHMALEYLFPDQFLYKIPTLLLPEQLRPTQMQKLVGEVQALGKSRYLEMIREGEVPLILWRDGSWDDYGEEVGDLNSQLDYYSHSWFLTHVFHREFFAQLKQEGRLGQYYRGYPLGQEPGSAILYVHHSIQKKVPLLAMTNQRLLDLKNDYREYLNPEVKTAFNLFVSSNQHFDAGRFLEAYLLLKRARDLDPESQEIREDLSIVQKNLGSWEKRILKKYSTTELLKILETQGKLPWDEKSRDLEVPDSGAKTLSPEEVEKRKAQAAILFRESAALLESDPEKARVLLEKVLELDPGHVNALEDLALLRQVGVKKTSLDLLREARATMKSNPDEARRLGQKALELNPALVMEFESLNQSMQSYGAILFSQAGAYFTSNPKIAMKLLEQVLRLQPDHAEARKDLDELKRFEPGQLPPKDEAHQEREIQAENLFSQSAQLFETSPQEARRLLLKVLDLVPGHKEAQSDLQILSQRLQVRSNRTRSPEEIQADRVFQKGISLFATDPEKSARLMREALRLFPDHKDAREDLKILEIKIRRREASYLYHEALSIQKTAPLKAITLLERVIRLDPKHKVARKALFKLNSFLKGNSLEKARARHLVEKAYKVLKTDPAKAKEMFRKALKLDPSNKEAREQVVVE